MTTRLLKELGIRRAGVVSFRLYLVNGAVGMRLSGRRGCYSPTKKDVNIAVQIRVEATAPAGRRGAVILRRGVARIPVSGAAAVMIAVGLLHRGHHRYLLHYPYFAVPVDV